VTIVFNIPRSRVDEGGAAQSKELKAAFEKHHGETEGQLSASKRFSR
jgi:hypothetical protein